MDRNSKRLKVAVIGCGRISVMHFFAISQLKDIATLVAICDNKPNRADDCAKKYGVKAYYDYKEMMDKEELDAVHIALPHYLHIPASEYAINKGIKVLCEKPMSIDYESAERATNLAKEKGVTFGIISQCRYNNSAKLIKKTISSGELGKIISVRSTLTWSRDDEYYMGSDWKGTWDKEGGGVVIDQAIHSIDLVHWIVNSEVEKISCSFANRGHSFIKVEDTAEGLITYKNGVKYAFYCMNNYGYDEPIEIRMYCEKGKVVFGYDDAYIYFNDGRVLEAHQTEENADVGGKDYWGFQHEKQVKQFYNACLGLEELDISAEEALKTHKLICDIYKIGKENFSK
ncbi:MAG: Gfo/Idh/MocA family oxidoreductase [Clostridia bacterium]|nr:Gfo/Idh/MocA family oxidoreductase [Clostridia bacterium]